MKLWGWAALGAGVVGLLALVRRDTQSSALSPNQREPMPSPNPKAPAGFIRYAGKVDAEMAAKAQSVLSAPFGSWHLFRHSSGKVMGALLEWHYHDPAGTVKPLGWHKGVSLFVRR